MLNILKSTILVLVLAGCADTGDALRARAATGVAGYTGRIFPISPPVKMRFAPVKEFRISARSYTKNANGEIENNKSFDLAGSIMPYGEHLQWRLGTPATDPLIIVRFVIDRRGAIKGDIQVDTFDHTLSDQEKRLVERLKILFLEFLSVFPEGKISNGSEVFSPEQTTKVAAKMYPNLSLEKNTYAGRAVGISYEFNRPNLVVKFSGTLEGKAGNNRRMAIRITGHRVFDVGTGLPVSHLLHMTASGIKNGRAFTAEQISSWEVVEVRY